MPAERCLEASELHPRKPIPKSRREPPLEVRKAPSLRLGLERVTFVDLRTLHDAWWGTKSVYRVAPAG
jgi:hypothetical protein